MISDVEDKYFLQEHGNLLINIDGSLMLHSFDCVVIDDARTPLKEGNKVHYAMVACLALSLGCLGGTSLHLHRVG